MYFFVHSSIGEAFGFITQVAVAKSSVTGLAQGSCKGNSRVANNLIKKHFDFIPLYYKNRLFFSTNKDHLLDFKQISRTITSTVIQRNGEMFGKFEYFLGWLSNNRALLQQGQAFKRGRKRWLLLIRKGVH